MKTKKSVSRPYGAIKHQTAEQKLLLWIIQLSLVSISRTLTAVSAPFSRIIAVQLFCGRSALRLLTWIKGVVLHWIAWLWQPAFSRQSVISRVSRQYGVAAIRRCHVILGEQKGRLQQSTASLRPLHCLY